MLSIRTKTLIEPISESSINAVDRSPRFCVVFPKKTFGEDSVFVATAANLQIGETLIGSNKLLINPQSGIFVAAFTVKSHIMTRTLLIVFFTASCLAFFSCKKTTYICTCRGANSGGQSYNLGNTPYSDAEGKCSALKTQNGWDSCQVVQPI